MSLPDNTITLHDQPASGVAGNPLSMAALIPDAHLSLESLMTEHEDLVVATEGLHRLCTSLESIQGETISPGTQQLINLAMGSYFHRVGLDVPAWSQTVSVENHHSVEVSLEGLRSVVGLVDDHTQAMAAKVKQALLNAIGVLSGVLPTTAHQWQQLNERVSEHRMPTQGDVDAKGIFKKLDKLGEWPDDLVEFLREYALLVEQIAHRFDYEAIGALSDNAKLIGELDVTSVSRYDETYRKLVDGWRDPRHSLPSNAFDAIIPGGPEMFTDHESTYKGEDVSIKKMEAFANQHIPNIDTSLFGKKTEVKERVRALPLSDIRALSKQYTTLTQSVNLHSHQHEEASAHASVTVGFYLKRFNACKDDFRRTVRDQHKALMAAYSVSYQFAEKFLYDTLRDLMSVSHGLQLYIVRSLKTSGKQAEDETVSQESLGGIILVVGAIILVSKIVDAFKKRDAVAAGKDMDKLKDAVEHTYLKDSWLAEYNSVEGRISGKGICTALAPKHGMPADIVPVIHKTVISVKSWLASYEVAAKAQMKKLNAIADEVDKVTDRSQALKILHEKVKGLESVHASVPFHGEDLVGNLMLVDHAGGGHDIKSLNANMDTELFALSKDQVGIYARLVLELIGVSEAIHNAIESIGEHSFELKDPTDNIEEKDDDDAHNNKLYSLWDHFDGEQFRAKYNWPLWDLGDHIASAAAALVKWIDHSLTKK